jgi:hypothetical protein
MPEILRSATLQLPLQIELPMSPPMLVIGRGTEGNIVCQLEITATGVTISGPRGGNAQKFNWDELANLVQVS